MREIAAVSIVFGAIVAAMLANITPIMFAAGVLLAGAVAIGGWAYVAWGGRDPWPKEPPRDPEVEAATFVARMNITETDVGESLLAEFVRTKRLLPPKDPIKKAIARHARRVAKRAAKKRRADGGAR